MAAGAGVLARFDVRTWPMAGAPRRLLPVLLGVESLALVVAATTLARAHLDLRAVLVTALLAALAIGFEEAMAHAARLQLRLGADLKRDLTSVWAVAGAVALPPTALLALLGTVTTYMWFRQNRPAGEALFRKVFNVSNLTVSALCAARVASELTTQLDPVSSALAQTAAAVGAIIAFTATNRALITCGLLALGVRGRDLIGSSDENLSELAGLCLGGLLSLAIAHQPLLAVLVIAPMVVLQRSAVLRKLETAATTDAKTGLLNAVAWEEIASRELARAEREGTETGILIIDVDHFKRVNDVHGHLVGDDLLRRIGQVLSAEVREYDTVARFGGEEFVAVLPSADAIEASAVAERIRVRIHDIWISSVAADVLPELDQRMGVSIGVAVAPVDGSEVSDLLQGADRALYRAKATGRNRVVLAGDGEGPRHFSVH